MALPVTITGLATAVAPVGPFKVAAGNYETLYRDSGRAGTLSNLPLTGIWLTNGIGPANLQGGVPPAGTVFTSATVEFAPAVVGSPTDNVVLYAYTVDLSGVPTGILATSNPVPAASCVGVVRFTFPSPVTPESGRYATFGCARTVGDAVNYPQLRTGSSSSNGSQYYRYNGTTWAVDSLAYQSIQLYSTITVAADAYYFFGRDGTTATTLRAFKSTAPDTSWTAGATSTGFTTAILGLAGYQVGTLIHLALYDGTSPTSVATKYIQYNAISDTFVNSETTKAAASLINAATAPSIIVRSNGEAVVFFQGVGTKVSSTTYARVYYSRRTAVNTWSTAIEVDAAAAVNCDHPIAVLGQADRVHFAFTAGTSGGFRTLSAANALNTGTTNATIVTFADGVGYVRGGVGKVVFTSAGTGQNTMYFNSVDNPTPTFGAQAIANARDPHRIGNDPFDNSVTIVYSNSADSDLYAIKSTNDGSTFAAPTSLFVGTVGATDLTLSRSSSGSMYDRGTNTVVGYVVNDNGTWKYNELVVRQATASGTGVLACGVSAVAGSGTAASIATGTGVLVPTYPTFTNLCLYSQDIPVGVWNKSGSLVVGNDAAAVAPDGTVTEDLLLDDTNFGFHTVYQLFSPALAAGQYTASLYAKPNTLDWIVLWVDAGSSPLRAAFDVRHGVVGTSQFINSANIVAAGNGWYRCSISFQSANTFTAFQLHLSNADITAPSWTGYQGDNNGSVWIWGAQFETGPVAGKYVYTWSAPASANVSAIAGIGTVASAPQEQLDPAKTTSNVTLSNSNKTATGGGSSGLGTSLSTPSLGDSMYVEAVFGALAAPDSSGIGFANASFNPFTAQGVGDAGSFGMWGGVIYNAGAAVGTPLIPTPVAGDIIGIGFNRSSNQAGFRNVSKNGDWVAFDISVLGAGSLYFGFSLSPGDQATVNFKGPFASVLPGQGYTTWGGTPLKLADGTGALTAQSATTATVGVSSSSGTGALQAVVATRSNQLTYSQDLDNAAWSPQNVSVAANVTTAPDSTLTAEQLTDTTANQPHYTYQTLIIPSRAATVSVYAKSGTLNWLQILVNGQGGYYWGNFNTTTGATGQSYGSPILSTTVLGNGWVRCSIAVPVSGDNPTVYLMLLPSDLGGYSYTGTGTGTLSLWGAQFEDGGVATAYIPTTNNPVSISDRPIVGVGTVVTVTSGTGALSATTSSLTGVGVAMVRGTAVLTSGRAALVAAGLSASIGTATLSAAISTLVSAGKSITTGTGALTAAISTAVGAGLSTSRNTAAALNATTSLLPGTGVSGSSGTGTAATALSVIAGVAASASVGTGALSVATGALAGTGSVADALSGGGTLLASTASLSAVGVSSSRVTSAVLSGQVASLTAAGLSKGTGTGTVSCSVTVLAAAGVSISAGTGVLTSTVSTLASSGQNAASGTGALAPAVASLSGAGISSSQVTSAVLQGQSVTVAAAGVSASAGSGALTATSAALSGVGREIAVGTAVLTTAISTLSGTGASTSVGLAAPLSSGAASLSGGGVALFEATGSLGTGVAALVAVGSSSSTATGVLSSGVAAVSGFEGVVIINGAGTLPALAATLTGTGQSRSTGTGVLLGGDGALLAAGSSQTSGAGFLPASQAVLAATGKSASSGSALLASGVAGAVGSGVILAAPTGTGALQSGTSTLVGVAGALISTGTGTLTTSVSGVAGAGFNLWSATGALAGQTAVLVGTGTVRWLASGSLLAAGGVLAGTGVSGSAVTGTLLAGRSGVFGAEGVVIILGQGDLSGQVSKVVSSGVTRSVGAGTLINTDTATVDADGIAQALGTGALTSSRSTATGTGGGLSLGSGAVSSGPSLLISVGYSRWVGSGVLPADPSRVATVGVSGSVGSGVLKPAVVTVAGAGTILTTGSGVLDAQTAHVFGSASLTTIGFGALIAADARVVSVGASKVTGTGTLRQDNHVIVAPGASATIGNGMLAAKPARVTGFGAETAYGSGDLQLMPASVSGDDLVVGRAIIVADACVVVGIGSVSVPVWPPSAPFPDSYPGTRPWASSPISTQWNGGSGTREWVNPGTQPWRKVA